VFVGPSHRHLAINERYQALNPGAELLDRPFADAMPALHAQGITELLDHVFATADQVTAADRLVPLPSAVGDLAVDRYFTFVVACYDDADGQVAGVILVAPETTEAVGVRERASREKDEFLRMASHELKTPISSVSLAVQMIERMLRRDALDTNRLGRLVVGIRTQVGRAAELVNDLLDVSRFETGALHLRREPVDLVALAQAAAERERDTLPDDARHQLVVEAPPDSTIRVQGDDTRLDQVLTNLLSNAVKYSPGGGVVRVQVGREAGDAVIRVIDHGIGIPSSERDRLFAPFSRTEAARESGVPGTGLGLYITRHIVEAHGGTVAVHDTPGGGATFTVKLPL
jgi:signal transduction histidine kinase